METHTSTPDGSNLDIGPYGAAVRLREFYGSTTFYDTSTGRRISWGFVNESDSESDRLTKGWACVQAIPSTIELDPKTACSDQIRSSLARDLEITGWGSQFTVLPTENKLSLRILADHSIVGTFVQGGRMAITARVYPTVAIGSKSHTFLFNNGTAPIRVKSLDVYEMGKVNMANF